MTGGSHCVRVGATPQGHTLRNYVAKRILAGNEGTIVMATSKTPSGRPVSKTRVASAGKPKPDNRVALTLKVDHYVYVRLCTLAATGRRTNQDVLLEAVEQYLHKAG